MKDLSYIVEINRCWLLPCSLLDVVEKPVQPALHTLGRDEPGLEADPAGLAGLQLAQRALQPGAVLEFRKIQHDNQAVFTYPTGSYHQHEAVRCQVRSEERPFVFSLVALTITLFKCVFCLYNTRLT